MENYCSNCIAVPPEANYTYASTKKCKCSCHRKSNNQSSDKVGDKAEEKA